MIGMVVVCLGLGVLLFCITILEKIGKERAATLKATQDTGVRGELFSVALPDNKVVIAGVVMSADEAKNFSYEYKDGYQVILERVGDKSVEVFRRKPRIS